MLLLQVKRGSRKVRPGSLETFPDLVGSSNYKAETLGRKDDFLVSRSSDPPNFLALTTLDAPPDCVSPLLSPITRCYVIYTIQHHAVKILV